MLMANPFAPLQDALRVLCTEAQVLPATGQAVVDMVMPDAEEIYDRAISGGARVEQLWETDVRGLRRDVRPIPRREEHGFRYFVDGSTKTYFIGTVLEDDRTSPVQLSQVGAAIVQREDDGRVKVAGARHSFLVTVEKIAFLSRCGQNSSRQSSLFRTSPSPTVLSTIPGHPKSVRMGRD